MTDEMTDEMLDRLEALSSHVVLRFADTEIAVVPVLVAEVKRLRKEKEIVTSMLFDQTPLLNRMQDTLDLLREPSEKVLLAAVEAVPYGASYAALMRCIPAAVAAAEREVSNDAR